MYMYGGLIFDDNQPTEKSSEDGLKNFPKQNWKGKMLLYQRIHLASIDRNIFDR